MGRDGKQPVIFMDRDGTIIIDKIYLNDPQGVKFYKDVFISMKKLQDAGYKFVIVTNQSGIARGFVKRRNVLLIHKKIKDILRKHGIKVYKIYFCPHHPDEGCGCRKPEIGMVKKILPKVDLKKSFMIGDLPTDIGFGKNLGVRTILIKRGKRSIPKPKPDFIVKNFYSAARIILKQVK